MLQPSFWDDRETADKLVGELKYIKNTITNIDVLSNSVNSALEMIDDGDDDVTYSIAFNVYGDKGTRFRMQPGCKHARDDIYLHCRL